MNRKFWLKALFAFLFILAYHKFCHAESAPHVSVVDDETKITTGTTGALLTSGTITFRGFVRSISVAATGGTVTWTGNWLNGTQTLLAGQSFSDSNIIPAISSPTIINATLPANTTFQYWIRGTFNQ